MPAVCISNVRADHKEHKNFAILQLTQFGPKDINFNAYFDRNFEFYTLKKNS